MISRLFGLAAGLLLWSGMACAQLDINSASAEQLDSLKGIGPVKAQAIVDYRRQHGPFRSVDELANVPGLGPAMVQKFRREVSVGRGANSSPAADRPSRTPQPSMPGMGSSERRDGPPRPALPGRNAADDRPPPARPAFPGAAPARPPMPAQPGAQRPERPPMPGQNGQGERPPHPATNAVSADRE